MALLCVCMQKAGLEKKGGNPGGKVQGAAEAAKSAAGSLKQVP